MSIADILALATLIKNETGINKNTAIRIGNALEEIIKYFRDNGGSGGGTSFVGAPITTTEALDAAFTPGVYGVNLPENYQDWEDRQFSLLVMPYAEYPINAFQVAIFSTLSLPFRYQIYIRFGNSAANPKWTPWGSISGGGGVGTETDPVFTAWLDTLPLAPYALQQWVTDNFALKESGVVPPVSEDILLTTAAPSYTVVAETADNINVSSTAAVGTVVLNALAADKALKISIKAGSNAVTIAGTAYAAGVVVFAVFTESAGTWSVDSTLDPVIPDYSDIKVQKRTTTAPTLNGWTYVITGIPAGGGAKGHLIFVDIPGSALSGVYSSLVNFAGTTTYAQKIIEGTALNVVRVGAGAVYHSEYDGANLASLKFNLTVSSEEKSNWNSKQDGTTNNITPTAGGGTYTILNNRINNLRSVWLLAGTHNFNLATVTDNNIINEQYIIFITGGTIPTINFVQPYYNGIGTVAITNGSTSVTVSGVNAQMVFKANQTFIANGVTYTVASVTNTTTIVLSVAASADFTGAYTYRPMLNYVYFPAVAINQLWHISFLYSNNGNAWVCDISVRII